MRYRKLELLLMSVGLVGILISMFTSLVSGATVTEILGQALFVPVLVFALHYGRQLGYAAAVGAALIFLIAKTQELGGLDLASSAAKYVVLQAAAFGLVGIIGGELAARIKYVVAMIADEEFIDNQTKLFSAAYMQKQIGKLMSGYARHGRAFSVLFIDLAWSEPIPETKRKQQVGRIANMLRGNVRLIDEVGYLNNGRFCLLLPETNEEGAQIVAERLKKARAGAGQYFRLSVEWSVEILSLPNDENEISLLAPEKDSVEIIA